MNETHHHFSPSSLKRRELCPGSAREEAGLPDVSGEYAAEGTRLHELIARRINGEAIEMKDEDAAIVDAAQNEFLLHEVGDGAMTTEARLSYSLYGAPLYYGTADVLVVNGKRGLIIDWKTGRLPVDDAADNLQGAAYVLAAMQQYKLDECEVVFYNPVIYQKTGHVYDGEQAIEISRQINAIIKRCNDPGAPCVPGKAQCQYCKAREHGTCQSYLASVKKAVIIAAAEPRAILSKLSDVELGVLIEAVQPAVKFEESLLRELKTRIEFTGEDVAGWGFKEVSGGREAKDINAVFERVKDDMTATQFIENCKLSVAQLEKTFAKIKKQSGETKTEKEAKEVFLAKVFDLIEEKPAKKQLIKRG